MTTTKQEFLAELVAEFHPIYSQSRDLRKQLLNSPNHFNLIGHTGVEGLIEETVRVLGKHGKCDGVKQDYADKSDLKTASIHPSKSGCREGGGSTYAAPISGVCRNGSEKIGALRVIYWNPHLLKGHYIFIPKKIWEKVCVGAAGQLRAYYNLKFDRFSTWSYGCHYFDNIKELALFRP